MLPVRPPPELPTTVNPIAGTAASSERRRQRDPAGLGCRRPCAVARRRDRHAGGTAAGGDCLTRWTELVAARRALGHARLLAVDDDGAFAHRRPLVRRHAEHHVAGTLTGCRRQPRDPAGRRRGCPRTLRLSRDGERAGAAARFDHRHRTKRHLTLHRVGARTHGRGCFAPTDGNRCAEKEDRPHQTVSADMDEMGNALHPETHQPARHSKGHSTNSRAVPVGAAGNAAGRNGNESLFPARCSTLTLRPATVNDPFRLLPSFLLTLNLTVPSSVPLAPDVILIHESLLLAVHVQVLLVDTLTLSVPPRLHQRPGCSAIPSIGTKE